MLFALRTSSSVNTHYDQLITSRISYIQHTALMALLLYNDFELKIQNHLTRAYRIQMILYSHRMAYEKLRQKYFKESIDLRNRTQYELNDWKLRIFSLNSLYHTLSLGLRNFSTFLLLCRNRNGKVLIRLCTHRWMQKLVFTQCRVYQTRERVIEINKKQHILLKLNIIRIASIQWTNLVHSFTYIY